MTERTRTDAPRTDRGRAWEVFLRERPEESMRHAGSVRAPTAETAHEQAGRLFPNAAAVWLCPTAEVARFQERSLGRTDGGGSATGADPGGESPSADGDGPGVER